MNQRAKNRIAEHADHGWIETAKTKAVRPELVLMECPATAPCHGWIGWLPKNLVEKKPCPSTESTGSPSSDCEPDTSSSTTTSLDGTTDTSSYRSPEASSPSEATT